MNLADTLRLIAAKSPNTSGEAARALGSVKRPESRPVQGALERALSDPAATFTPDERAVIAGHLTGGSGGTRSLEIRLRVTPDEKERVQVMADEARLTVSDLIRQRLGLE